MATRARRSNAVLIVQLLVVMTLTLALGGCAKLVDTDAARLCRTLIPALDPGGATIDVVETHETKTAPDGSFTVAIDYLVSQTSEIRRLTCQFAFRDWPTAMAANEALVRVATPQGDIGDIRLHLLKRHWIDSGMAGANDPAPYATLGSVPRTSTTTAFAIQILVASTPAIAIYALLAAAYALVYGLLGRINLAFGELTVLSGYAAFLGYALAQNPLLALASAAAFGAFAAIVNGAALGRFVMAPLAKAPGQHLLIATLGMAIAWSEFVRLAQGNGNRWMPPLLNRPLALAKSDTMTATVTPMAVVVLIVASLAIGALLVGMNWSRFGRHWRASTDDAIGATLCGIDTRRVLTNTMVITSLLAATVGLLMTIYYGGVGFTGGLTTSLKALVAAILGGIASPGTAVLGGLVVGLAEVAWSALLPIELRDPAIFALLALTLALKPEGLFARG